MLTLILIMFMNQKFDHRRETFGYLYRFNVVLMKFKIALVALIKRRHQRLSIGGMLQAQRMADLMCGHLQQVGTRVRFGRPVFLQIKVNITAIPVRKPESMRLAGGQTNAEQVTHLGKNEWASVPPGPSNGSESPCRPE